MELNKVMEKCLKDGEIWISAYCRSIICLQYKVERKPVVTIHSDRGIEYGVLLLIAKVLGYAAYKKIAEKKHPHPLGPMGATELDLFFFEDRYTRMYKCGKDMIHILSHQAHTPTINSEIGPYYKKGVGHAFHEALESMLKADPHLELVIPGI